MKFTCTCPECKNPLDLSKYPSIEVSHVIECSVCGITLAVQAISPEGVLEVEIVDEGK
jgi:hypothetical protein